MTITNVKFNQKPELTEKIPYKRKFTEMHWDNHNPINQTFQKLKKEYVEYVNPLKNNPCLANQIPKGNIKKSKSCQRNKTSYIKNLLKKKFPLIFDKKARIYVEQTDNGVYFYNNNNNNILKKPHLNPTDDTQEDPNTNKYDVTAHTVNKVNTSFLPLDNESPIKSEGIEAEVIPPLDKQVNRPKEQEDLTIERYQKKFLNDNKGISKSKENEQKAYSAYHKYRTNELKNKTFSFNFIFQLFKNEKGNANNNLIINNVKSLVKALNSGKKLNEIQIDQSMHSFFWLLQEKTPERRMLLINNIEKMISDQKTEIDIASLHHIFLQLSLLVNTEEATIPQITSLSKILLHPDMTVSEILDIFNFVRISGLNEASERISAVRTLAENIIKLDGYNECINTPSKMIQALNPFIQKFKEFKKENNNSVPCVDPRSSVPIELRPLYDFYVFFYPSGSDSVINASAEFFKNEQIHTDPFELRAFFQTVHVLCPQQLEIWQILQFSKRFITTGMSVSDITMIVKELIYVNATSRSAVVEQVQLWHSSNPKATAIEIVQKIKNAE